VKIFRSVRYLYIVKKFLDQQQASNKYSLCKRLGAVRRGYFLYFPWTFYTLELIYMHLNNPTKNITLVHLNELISWTTVIVYSENINGLIVYLEWDPLDKLIIDKYANNFLEAWGDRIWLIN